MLVQLSVMAAKEVYDAVVSDSIRRRFGRNGEVRRYSRCRAMIFALKGAWAPEWRHVLMIGFLGAFTTFSTFSLDALNMWQNGHQTLALSYAAITFAASLAAVVASVEVTQRLV